MLKYKVTSQLSIWPIEEYFLFFNTYNFKFFKDEISEVLKFANTWLDEEVQFPQGLKLFWSLRYYNL